METEAPAVAPASIGSFSEAANAGSRYDALLRQIVQLNTDLQKTAALSQTLQRERDDAQQHNVKLKGEVKRLNERCDKLQLVLMQETEQKAPDKKHEELIAKWKKQLEVKARAFETLQKKFAPPRDLEQLRMKIQEELEGPYQQRIEGLQDEVEQHRQMSFDIRREFEALKAEATIGFDGMDRINELVLKLQAAEAAAQKNSSAAAQLRDNDSSITEHSLLIKAREDDLEKYRELMKAAEKKVAVKEEELRQCQHEADETIHKLHMEMDSSLKMVQKRDAYKRKCLEIHESYKQLANETNCREAKLQQYKQEHAAEMQQLLTQLSEAESDKTALMQRQVQLGFPPSDISTKNVRRA
ncbi:hypothetical protein PHYBOEH_004557 [Phytophthora boehmeriae]|uniref:Uncharacterized protein n=1 Tax=Phytophthora boehmeriae TaxID=109152 RepID=A0A8T1X524_9STRA|nr:hypothetical protein PHYBOEH_004557 [Phytophthora boehmeriae]